MFQGGGKVRTSTVTQSIKNQSRIKSMKTAFGIVERINQAGTITELDALVAEMRDYTMIAPATLRRGLRKANARAMHLSNPR